MTKKVLIIIMICVLSFAGIAIASDTEPNDTYLTAKTIAMGASQPHPLPQYTISSASDVDWFKFTASAGQQIVIDLYDMSSGDIEMDLCDQTGQRISPEQYTVRMGTAPDRIVATAAYTGTHYIKVFPDQWTTTITYRIWVSVQPSKTLTRPTVATSRVVYPYDLDRIAGLRRCYKGCTHDTSFPPYEVTHTYDQHDGTDYGWHFSSVEHPYDYIYSAGSGNITNRVIDPRGRYNSTEWTLAGSWYGISHSATLWTNYCHLDANSLWLPLGQYVARAQQIALMGRTGSAAGKHLHMGVSITGSTGTKVCPYQNNLLSWGGARNEQ